MPVQVFPQIDLFIFYFRESWNRTCNIWYIALMSIGVVYFTSRALLINALSNIILKENREKREKLRYWYNINFKENSKNTVVDILDLVNPNDQNSVTTNTAIDTSDSQFNSTKPEIPTILIESPTKPDRPISNPYGTSTHDNGHFDKKIVPGL